VSQFQVPQSGRNQCVIEIVDKGARAALVNFLDGIWAFNVTSAHDVTLKPQFVKLLLQWDTRYVR
jgi:hypothetical protein